MNVELRVKYKSRDKTGKDTLKIIASKFRDCTIEDF